MCSTSFRKCLYTTLLAFVVLQLNACGYPEVSPQTYKISKALYSACNQKSEERLQVVSKLIQSSLEKKEITDREAQYLNDIIAQAKDNQWETAMVEARSLMEDQIGN